MAHFACHSAIDPSLLAVVVVGLSTDACSGAGSSLQAFLFTPMWVAVKSCQTVLVPC